MAQGSQYNLAPVEVITATIDIEEVRSQRSSSSRNVQGANQRDFERIQCDIKISRSASDVYLSDSLKISTEITLRTLDTMEEMYMAEAVYLWQYLTRTNSGGYFLALSGGLDSCTVALFVFGMARLVLEYVQAGEQTVIDDLRRITGETAFTPSSPQAIMSKIFHTW